MLLFTVCDELNDESVAFCFDILNQLFKSPLDELNKHHHTAESRLSWNKVKKMSQK